MLDDQAVERLRAFQTEFRAEPAVERTQRRHAVDDDTAVRLASEALGAARRLRREFADDLLDDVLDRDQALQLAVLVDNESETLPIGLELLQLREQRRADRNEIRRTQQRANLLGVELPALQHVQD